MVRLGDVCEVVSGSTPKTNIEKYWNGQLKWITPAEIDSDTYIVSDSQRHITEAAVKDTGLKPFPKGTVILSSRAPIGKVAIAGTEMYCNQGFKNLICSDKINNRYLYQFLSSKTEYLNSLGRGATFKELSKGIIENIEIVLPLLDEQENIANAFEKLNNIIIKRKQQLQKLDELVKARFVEMFGDVNQNDRCWEQVILGEICEIKSSKRVFEKDYVENGIPFFRTKEIVELSRGNKITTELFISNSHFENIKSLYGTPQKNDLLISAVGTIGTIWIVDGEFDFYFKDGNIIQVKASDNFNSIFMKFLLTEVIRLYKNEMSTGTAYLALTIAGLKNMIVYDVPLIYQNQFADFVEQINKSKLSVQKSLEKFETLKEALMQKYFG